MRILDGAVCILDGVAGVEAQTEKVWNQAGQYQIPKILFVNKLDRDGAAFARTVREVGTRLDCWPAVCGIPWWRSSDSKLQGIGDAIGLRAILYEEGGDGKTVKNFDIDTLGDHDSAFAEEIKKARIALVELLSEHDDEMVEKFLEHDEDHLAIPALEITECLRRCTLASPQTLVPLFAGASFRNVGVQPLLDAVVDLLPSPLERPDPETRVGAVTNGLNSLLSGEVALPLAHDIKRKKDKSKAVAAGSKAMQMVNNLEACALAFKVVTDPRRGVLVYVRVYSGVLSRNSSLFNTNLAVTEKAPRLLRMYADEAVEIPSIPAGQIGVIPGLKYARTGDTLISYLGSNPKVGPPAPINTLQLRPIDVPPPVFFTSVEPNSLAEEKHLNEALDLLLREDPSLHVHQDAESGQTHLAGMGELHLEIARDRLITDLKAKARTGSIQIGYREAITASSKETEFIFDKEVAGKSAKAGCSATAEPYTDIPHDDSSDDSTYVVNMQDNNLLIIKTPTLYSDGTALDSENPSLPPSLPISTLRTALLTGVTAALARGPTHSYPMHSTSITLTFNPHTHLFASTTPAALSSAARLAVQNALRGARDASATGTVLMEPVMRVTISVDAASLGAVVHDISSARGGQVTSLGAEDDTEKGNAAFIDPTRIYAPPDPFAGSDAGIERGGQGSQMRTVVARVPLKEMVGYLKHLRSLTQGRGGFVMAVDRFERMGAQRMKVVVGEMTSGLGDY